MARSSSPTVPFTGFPAGAAGFFTDLAADNTREFWQASRERFEHEVRGPMAALAAAVATGAGPMRLFRMNRDVRFSTDKSPYKLQLGAHAEDPDGVVRYVHLDAEGLLVARGYYVMARDQLARFRDVVADESSGPRFVAAVDHVEGAGLTVDGGLQPPLTTAPRGYPADHPRIAWLRWKGLGASCRIDDPARLSSPGLADEVLAAWAAAEPLMSLVGRHVGPSTEPPPGRPGDRRR